MGRVTGERGVRARLRRVAGAVAGLIVVAALAGCAIPKAPPTVHLVGTGLPTPPTAQATGGSQTVLLVGDSLLWQAAGPLRDDLRAHGMRAKVVNAAVVGSGLLNPIHDVTPVEYLKRRLDATHPTLVVFEYSGNYDGLPHVPLGSPVFEAAWMEVVRSMTHVAQAAGAAVTWVVPPPRFPQAGETDHLARVYERLLPSLPGVTVADWWSPFVDAKTDRYVNYLKIGERTVRVRNTSVIHFTKAGATRAARWLTAALRPAWDAA